jgi:hypothetical protein
MKLGLGNVITGGSAFDIFIPSSIDNLALWLKVNNNITSDEDGSGAVSHSSNAGDMADEDKVNAWNAFGDTSINAVQTTSADKPLWETDAADFGGVNSPGNNKHFDLSSPIVFNANTDFTIVVRVKPSDFASRAIMGDTASEFIRLNSNTVIRMKIDNTNRDFTLGSGTIATDKYITILIVRSDGATGNINIYVRGEDSGYFDGTAAGTAFGSELQDAGEITVSNLMASSDGGTEFNGFFKDVIIYDGTAVDSTQREQLFDYIESQNY